MRVCPACGNQYSDDANFCPMDATRLPPPAAAQPAAAAAGGAAARATPAASTLENHPSPPIAARYVPTGPTVTTPTGSVCEAKDTTGGGQVMLKLVAAEV